MAVEPELRKQIDELLLERQAGFEAQQLLKIRDEVAAQVKKTEDDRRSRLQFLTAIGGVSLVALVAFAYSEVRSIAEDSATSAVEEPITRVVAAEQTLEGAVDQFDDIRAQIATSQQTVEVTRQRVQRLLGDVEEALGEVRAAQGGVGIANDLSRIYRRLEEIEFSNRTQRVTPASPPIGPSISDLLPGVAQAPVEEGEQSQ